MLLHEILEDAARRAPSTLALAVGDDHVDYAALDERARRLAGAVSACCAPGDRVAIVADNRIEYADAYYGVPRAGRILAPLNQRLHPREMALLLQRCSARVLLGAAPVLDALRPHLASTAVEVVVDLDRDYAAFCDGARPHGETHHDVETRDERTVAWLIATSGTTGEPKWAMLTHRSLTAAITNVSLCRPITSDDVLATPFPLCHVAGYNVLAFHLHARPVVLLARFDAEALNAAIAQHRVRTLSLAPTMIAAWLDHPGTATADPSSVRVLGYGASAIPSPLLRRAVAQLGAGVGLSQGYGMTELSGNVAFLGPDEHRRAAAGDERLARAAGRPGPLAAVRVVDDAGCDARPGETGEIVVRGDQVFAGYWDEPAATTDAFLPGGWLRTGDLGRLDADGLLSIVDRSKDVIVTGGENVASREVEQVLEQHPGVREVAVVGTPDATWGERVCAVVVPSDPESPPGLEELVRFARERLAGFKKPTRLAVVDELPRNATGKVRKDHLRAQLHDLLETP
jgi:acyl-CoA synthetase (AMP-forming)/AMP-acid ligase II